MPSSRPYRWLAKYYDRVFSPFRAPIDNARHQILEPLLPRIASACELACGTGTVALELARSGIRTYAVDLSPGMCRITREKALQQKVPLRVLRADMREFRLRERVDLVTCEYDALNHVPRKADLAKVLRAVARALEPGGHFYFDVNNLAGFERYWNGCFWVERPGLVLVMRNGHDSKKQRAWSDVEWFIEEGSLWRRHTERVEEVCWTAAEIRQALQKAGFDRIRAWDAAPFFEGDDLTRRGCRTFYLARKGLSR
ncbi:MAG: class I SAM-dependent methyltransferase [Bryobacteraceae bacterium]